MFAYVHPSAELRYVLGGGTSFFCIQGADYVRVPQPISLAMYLWSEGPPDMSASGHYQFMQKAIQHPAVQHSVDVLFKKLKPPAAVYKEHLRQAFSLMDPHILHEDNQELEEHSM